jgi:hypothetical protein
VAGYQLPPVGGDEQTQQYILPPNDYQVLQQQGQYHAQNEQPTGSSCYAVANMIRGVNPQLGAELEVELGCADGSECNVSNMRAFEVLDRVSGGV